jgi:hypothetical protein
VGLPGQDIESRYYEASLPLDQGDWAVALDEVSGLADDAAEAKVSPETLANVELMALTLRAYAPDEAFKTDLRAWTDVQVERLVKAGALLRRQAIFHVLAGAWMSAHTGDAGRARELLAGVEDENQAQVYPANAAMIRVVKAEIALAEGRPADAVALLADDHGKDEGIYFSRAVLVRALAASGDRAQAARVAAWMTENRGVAFGEPTYNWGWQLANVAESTLALRAAARLSEPGSADAVSAGQAFEKAWPDGAQLPQVTRRDAAL